MRLAALFTCVIIPKHMIPQFPEFKKLELSDKDEVESFTKKFPPYSDFNFISMWSWDVKAEVRISELNGNLVVRFTDYLTGEPFYSFLGNTKVNETAEALIEVSRTLGLNSKLKLVPEDSVLGLNKEIFKVEEDRNNHDYVIPVRVFKDYDTKKTSNKRKAVKKFLKEFTVHTEELDLCNPEVNKVVYELFEKWSLGKGDPLEVQNELKALHRFIENKCGETNHICTGIYVENQLVGFCLSEILNGHFSNVHFCKGDTTISAGVYAYVLQENARILHEMGHEYVNIEQDLGIDNMRQWKMSHGEQIFLKKYTVSFISKPVLSPIAWNHL